MRGGAGTVYGALLGALVITSLDNGMSMLDVDSYWQMIVKGSILVLAVWVDVSTRTGQTLNMPNRYCTGRKFISSKLCA